MPRPTKCRRIDFYPESTEFAPVGKTNCSEDKICLKIEELEAMRLKDIEELSQEECAEKMRVSRQTFQNIIESARKKVTSALIEGKELQIKGGNYTFKECKLKCLKCGTTYDINFQHDKNICPNCGSSEVVCSNKNKNCKKWCKDCGVLE